MRTDRSRAVKEVESASSTTRLVCITGTGGIAIALGNFGGAGRDAAPAVALMVVLHASVL